MITDNEHIYITLEKKYKNFKVKITQEYLLEDDIGHYICIIENNNGDIVCSTSSCAGAPKGKVTFKKCSEILKSFKSAYKIH